MSEEGTVNDDDALLRKLAARVREENAEPELPEGAPRFDGAMADRIAARLLEERPAKVASTNVVRPARFRWAIAAAPLAAAAAFALWIASRPPSAALPGYEVSVIGAKAMRADPSVPPSRDEVELDPEGDFELVARPSERARDVAARAVLLRDGVATVWRVPVDVSDEGSVRIAGPTKALFPETQGRYEIVLLVAPHGGLPSELESPRVAATGARVPGGGRVFRARVRFVDR